jgi:peptide/nickel transport system ATP-binding protein
MSTMPGVPASTEARLRVSDLRIERVSDGADIAAEVNLTVNSGEILGIVGESGSGKSTVALALLAHARKGLRIARGSVIVGEQDMLTLTPAGRREARGRLISYVPQDPASALDPAMRIGDQIMEAQTVHKDFAANAESRTLELLEEVRLPSGRDLLRKYPHQLSGGQQQRVAIAMAFACRPSLIVLDEPTTGLDVSTERHVLNTVRELCANYDAAAVFVTHDLVVVSNLASSLAVMYAGRVVESGSTASVFASPRHPYTRALLRSVPKIEVAEILATIPGRSPRPGERPPGCSFAARCGQREERCATPPPLVDVDGVETRCWRPFSDSDAIRSPLLSSRVQRASDVIIRAEHLTASYGDTRVLHDVSLELPRGVCTAIVGESGSGKTTLARCLVGLHANYHGSISLHGEVLAPASDKRSKTDLRRIQYIFQNPYNSLNQRKRVGQIIEQGLASFGDHSRKERRARVEAALADVSLEASLLDRYPDQLSGGERQRVAIARALAVEPEILICDEITSALDVSVQSVVVELLRDLQHKRDITIAFITHNLALVRVIAQEVVVVSQGRIVESGPVDEVLTSPKAAYTVRLLEDVPRLQLVPVGRG